MSPRQARYKNFEKTIILILTGAFILFITFLIASGLGITWLKLLSSILAILLCCLCLILLVLTKELLTQRSLWMSVWSAATVLCILFSLILKYPSPNPYSSNSKTASTASDTVQDSEN